MDLSYFIGKIGNLKRIIFWFIAIVLAITIFVLIRDEHSFLSPAARHIYNGIFLSN